MAQKWSTDLWEIGKWALQVEDLHYRFVYSDSATEISKTGGLVDAFETAVVLRILEAACAKGYRWGSTIAYEHPYPGAKPKTNPQRADLAFKDKGKGKNWAYVEVKYWSKAAVADDVTKLKAIQKRVQRWMLVYRIAGVRKANLKGAPIQTLGSLMAKILPLGSQWVSEEETAFPSVLGDGTPGECQIWLGRLK
jgi:hypothetical protein